MSGETTHLHLPGTAAGSGPAQAIARSLAEVEEEWNRQAERYTVGLRPSPLRLLEERRHPLVRTEMAATARRRRLVSALCVSVPLIFLLACAATHLSDATGPATLRRVGGSPWSSGRVVRALVRSFVCLWPTLMFTGAALGAAGSVISDRSRQTAAQIVLTPLSGQTIAAARILPWPGPFALGILAALPLYVWGAHWEYFCARGAALTPLALWPLRMLALPGALTDVRGLSPSWTGGLCGLFMLVSDLALIWAAAHWGAAYAVWLGSLPGVAVFMAWRLFYVSVLVAAWMIPILPVLIFWWSSPQRADIPMAVMLLVLPTVCLSVLGWHFLLRGATRMALVEFLRYDRLAGDDFRPGYFKRFHLKVRSEGPPRL